MQLLLRPYLLEREEKSDFSIFSFVLAWGVVLYFAYSAADTFNLLDKPNSRSPSSVPVQPGAVISTALTPVGVTLPTSTVVSSLTPTATLYPTYTPYPTFTPSVNWLQGTPASTHQAFNVQDVKWVFSYYCPPLVAEPGMEANCHPDNYLYAYWDDTKIVGCKDITSSGLPWSHYKMYGSKDARYAGGIAVPYYPGTYDPIYPMFSVLHVSQPTIIAGDYLVIDICPGCNLYIETNGVLFLDFVAGGLPDDVTFWDVVFVDSVTYP